jgi:hypothetical protein
LQEALLGPVLSQFSMMQQQLLEQFHQTMVMMAQVFGNLHRDQMALIREELTQLHQVTQELQTLHVELARRPPTEAAVEDGLPQSAGARTAGGEHAVAAPPARHPPAQPAARPQPDRPPPPVGEEADNIHTLLRQRLEALEAERKSRWDRILRFMMGR